MFYRFFPDFHHDQSATKTVFFLAGFVTAAWAAIIPFVKANVQISDGVVFRRGFNFLGDAVKSPH